MPRFAVLLTLAVAALAAACFRSPPPSKPEPDAATDLLRLVRARLDLAHDVARAKWATKAPVSDPDRERAFLADMAEDGRRYGLDPDDTERFFAAQIEAAKRVQEDDLRRWREDGRGPAGRPPDLRTEVRPKIDRVSREMLPALARFRSERTAMGETDVRRTVNLALAGVPADARTAAAAPLLRMP